MRALFTFILLFVFTFSLQAQVQYDGPADGQITGGYEVSTDDFTTESGIHYGKLKLFNDLSADNYPDGRGGFFGGEKIIPSRTLRDDSILVYRSFNGIPDLKVSIPPDPYLACGPEYIIHAVNSRFRISDKEGNTIKTINADDWFANVLEAPNSFDPKVIYDDFENRWIMAWLHLNNNSNESYYLISVSDDENPLGLWYNWAIPGNLNGMTPDGYWADYTGVGFDDKAIYLASDQFTYAGEIFKYERIKIIDKSTLYISSGPAVVQWKDLWNIKYPGTNVTPYMIRPVQMADPSSEYYFLVIEPDSISANKTTVGLYKLSDPLGTPSLTGTTIDVAEYQDPLNPSQMGGGTPLKIWGSNFLNEPVFRNGKLHATHTVANGDLCSVRYLCIKSATNELVSDFVISDQEHYYFYSALDVNARGDVLITYSRSSANEYVGAFYSVINAYTGQPSSSMMMQSGKARYVKTFGGEQNRWGDYMGVWVDPADEETFWIASEYTPDENVWGVWVSAVRTELFQEQTYTINTESIDLGLVEIPSTAESQELIIRNAGQTSLEIYSMTLNESAFSLNLPASLPVTLQGYDSLKFTVTFEPSATGVYTESIVISSSDQQALRYVKLSGQAFRIYASTGGELYGSTSSPGGSALITINARSGAGSEIGEHGFSAVTDICINRSNYEILGLASGASVTNIVRVNSVLGDAWTKFEVDALLNSFTITSDGTWFATDNVGIFYIINPATGELTEIGNTGLLISALAENPLTGDLYASLFAGDNKDELYLIDKATGSAQLLGSTGIDNYIDALTFTDDGLLWGAYDKIFQPSALLLINTDNLDTEEIGSIGIKSVLGLAVTGTLITEISPDKIGDVPSEYKLQQNYPNPFNPVTNIKFQLPESANVLLEVYDMLGRKIVALVNEELPAGYYSIEFDASQLASGTYIYKLKTDNFTASGKMMLLK